MKKIIILLLYCYIIIPYQINAQEKISYLNKQDTITFEIQNDKSDKIIIVN